MSPRSSFSQQTSFSQQPFYSPFQKDIKDGVSSLGLTGFGRGSSSDLDSSRRSSNLGNSETTDSPRRSSIVSSLGMGSMELESPRRSSLVNSLGIGNTESTDSPRRASSTQGLMGLSSSATRQVGRPSSPNGTSAPSGLGVDKTGEQQPTDPFYLQISSIWGQTRDLTTPTRDTRTPHRMSISSDAGKFERRFEDSSVNQDRNGDRDSECRLRDDETFFPAPGLSPVGSPEENNTPKGSPSVRGSSLAGSASSLSAAGSPVTSTPGSPVPSASPAQAGAMSPNGPRALPPKLNQLQHGFVVKHDPVAST